MWMGAYGHCMDKPTELYGNPPWLHRIYLPLSDKVRRRRIRGAIKKSYGWMKSASGSVSGRMQELKKSQQYPILFCQRVVQELVRALPGARPGHRLLAAVRGRTVPCNLVPESLKRSSSDLSQSVAPTCRCKRLLLTEGLQASTQANRLQCLLPECPLGLCPESP